MESAAKELAFAFEGGRTEQPANTKTDGNGHACKGLFLLSRSAEMGGRRKHTVFLSPQRERQATQKRACWGNFKVELGMLTMGIENRDGMVTAPVDPADLLIKAERPEARWPPHGGGLRPRGRSLRHRP